MHGTMHLSMRNRLLASVRRALGTQGLNDRLATLQSEVDALQAGLAKQNGAEAPAGSIQDDLTALRVKMEEMGKYQFLPGTKTSRYAVPLDAAPSRHLRPRWGNIQPPIAPLLDWMSSGASAYQDVLDAMRRHAAQFAAIDRDFDAARLPQPGILGAPLSPFDAAAVYAIVADKRPKRVIEIGPGVAAAFAKRSIQDQGIDARITVIDPEPHAGIETACDKLVRRALETTDLSIFDQLEAGDVVLLESTHRAFTNSDVTVFMIDVLPRLKPGVVIAMSEVHLPWDYPDRFNDRYWNEAYILAAYLIGARERVEPILPTAWITRGAQFASWFETPLIDLGDANGQWRSGSALWFTHRA